MSAILVGRSLAFAIGICLAAFFFLPRLKYTVLILVSVAYSARSHFTFLALETPFRSPLLDSLLSRPLPLFFFSTGSILICWLYRECISRIGRDRFLARHGFAIFFGAALVLSCLVLPPASTSAFAELSWKLLVSTMALLPFLFYEIEAIGDPEPWGCWERLLFYRPIWSFAMAAPIGRGAAALTRAWAHSREDFEEAQLSGVKLMLGSLVLYVSRAILGMLFFSRPSWLLAPLPRFDLHPGFFELSYLISNPAILPNVPTWKIWFSVLANFFDSLMRIALWGNFYVAVARMLGLRIFRNTYRPFQATSFADFFGRYNFYFKELLFHAFFFPTFQSRFLKHKQLRIAFAAFMAAGLGNFLFQLALHISIVADLGFGGAFTRLFPYLIYCGGLGAAVAISMAWNLPKPKLYPAARILLYVTVFALLLIFDVSFAGPVERNLAVFAALFAFR